MAKLNAFEIQIPLTEMQKVLVSMWLERFHAHSVHIWSTPELKDQILTIHPADFTNLISFAEPGDCTELEFYRLRKLGSDIIESTLTNRRTPLAHDLKEMTLDALCRLTPQKIITEKTQELELPEII